MEDDNNYGDTARALIVNADDFGRAPSVNEGVIEAFEQGVVTSASLMVRWPASEEAVAYANDHQDLSLGIHLDLGEWRRGEEGWENVYQNVALGDAQAIQFEVANQLGRFHKIAGRPPTHIDSHQHVHEMEPVRSIVAEFARKLQVPVRNQSPRVRYCGHFYGQMRDGSSFPEGISVESMLNILDEMGPGVTEVSCHPGSSEGLDSTYASERSAEVRTLCNPAVRWAIENGGIALISFRHISELAAGRGARDQ
jgi:predicted glycoside hydrolase/deacetylase ChbG (UPF0249 family)